MKRAMIALLCLLIFATAASAQALKPARNLVVVDAIGAVIGAVLDLPSDYGMAASTALLYDGYAIPVIVSETGMRALNGGVLLYESADCSGPALLPPASMGMAAAFVDMGGALWVGNPSETPVTRLIRARSSGPGDCSATTLTTDTVSALNLGNVATLYPPPYRIVAPRNR